MSELEPLSETARQLLDEECAVDAARPELRERVMARLEAAFGPGLGFDAEPGGSGGTSGPDGGPGRGGGPAAGGPPSPPAGFSLAGGKLAATLVTTLVLGAGGAILIDRAVRRTPPTAAPTDDSSIVATTTVSAPPIAFSVAAPSAAPAESTPPLSAARPSANPVGPAYPASDLAKERTLIDAARAGVARGHPNAALEAVRRHESLYPRGQLREEREGIRILALAAAGRFSDARTRAETFRRNFPDSVLLPSIDAVLEVHHP